MKRTLFIMIAAMLLGIQAHAQGIHGSRQAIGIRGGWGAELSYQRYVAPENRFEGTVGINRFGFSLEGLYQFMNNIPAEGNGELKWYYGAGAGIGSWNHEEYDTGFACAVLGQIGIEYSFANAPLMFSFDYRPGIYFAPQFNFDWSGFALGLRFYF